MPTRQCVNFFFCLLKGFFYYGKTWNGKNCILLLKLFWPTLRNNCSSDLEKLLIYEAEGIQNCKNFEITKAIHSNSQRSEEFLVTECFFSLFLEVSHLYYKGRCLSVCLWTHWCPSNYTSIFNAMGYPRGTYGFLMA